MQQRARSPAMYEVERATAVARVRRPCGKTRRRDASEWVRRRDEEGACVRVRVTETGRPWRAPRPAILLAHRRSAAAPRVTASTIATRGAPTLATATRLRRGALPLASVHPSSRCCAALTPPLPGDGRRRRRARLSRVPGCLNDDEESRAAESGISSNVSRHSGTLG